MESDKDYCENAPEMVNHPKHYTSLGAKCDACGAEIEVIQVTQCLDFVIGNIVKYACRAGHKCGATKLQDLQKCLWYAARAVELEKRNEIATEGYDR